MTSFRTIAICLAALIVLLALSLFTVREGENAFLLRLGKIVTVSESNTPLVLSPGLHFKIPFIDQVHIFDVRMQHLSTSSFKSLTVVTKEQTYLVVDYFAKWRISDLSKFYTSMGGSATRAEDTVLEPKLNDIIRTEYGKRTSNQAISTDRFNMMAAIKEQASAVGKKQGITVLDVQIQQITLPKDVIDSVFKRMATERKQFAEAKRAEGYEKSEEIRALADQKATVIKAEALMQAATIRAEGDQTAAQIFSKAYSVNPKFYSFYRSLEAYTQSFHNKSDILVLKPEGQFFNYFHNMNAQGNTAGNSANKR
jgi:membrane protease subunit HflC